MKLSPWIAFATLLLWSLAASAQETMALPQGWTLHKKFTGRGYFPPNAIACNRDKAFVRTWSGDVAAFDGAASTVLPVVPGNNEGKTYGRSVSASASGEVYLETSGRLARWDGTSWSFLDAPNWDGELLAQTTLPSGDVVLAGRGMVGLRTGNVIVSYDAGTWRELSAITGLSLLDLWTAGQGGTIMHRTAQGWSRQQTGTTAWLDGLLEFAPDNVWAWSSLRTDQQEAVVLRWNGKDWSSAAQGLKGRILGISGNPAHLWAIKDTAVASWDGASWSLQVTSADLGSGVHSLVGVCATSRVVVVVDSNGNALVRAL